MVHVSAAIFTQATVVYLSAQVSVLPLELTVDPVPAAKVRVPAPFLSKIMLDPTGNATAESWGNVIVIPEPGVHNM